MAWPGFCRSSPPCTAIVEGRHAPSEGVGSCGIGLSQIVCNTPIETAVRAEKNRGTAQSGRGRHKLSLNRHSGVLRQVVSISKRTGDGTLAGEGCKRPQIPIPRYCNRARKAKQAAKLSGSVLTDQRTK